MAGLGDVLRHLVATAPGLGDDHRGEYLDAVNAAYPPPPPPEPDPAEKEARKAELLAELGALGG